MNQGSTKIGSDWKFNWEQVYRELRLTFVDNALKANDTEKSRADGSSCNEEENHDSKKASGVPPTDTREELISHSSGHDGVNGTKWSISHFKVVVELQAVPDACQGLRCICGPLSSRRLLVPQDIIYRCFRQRIWRVTIQ